MYGYLKFSPSMVGKENYKLLKKYYCATCLALKRNYGFFAPLVLSYDLVIVPILFNVQDASVSCCDKCFYKKRKCCYPPQDEIWKKIAAINLAIAEQKINDSLNDERKWVAKIKYKIARCILNSSFKKASQLFPNIFNYADIGMKKTIQVENAFASLEEQSCEFGNMILAMLNCIRPLTENEAKFIMGISEWLCLIDAIDDYNKDFQQARYNPLLLNEYPSVSIFISEKYCTIIEKITNIYNHLQIADNQLLKIYERSIVPQKTSAIFKKALRGD